jgi:hypothetical protein
VFIYEAAVVVLDASERQRVLVDLLAWMAFQG